MKVIYTVFHGKLSFEVEAATAKAAFESVANIQEVFGEEICGSCGSKTIRFDVREFDKNLYYKLVCLDCHAQFDFGQKKDMINLFPKRRDKEGNALPDGGWYHYKPEGTPTVPAEAPKPDKTTSEPDQGGIVKQWANWLKQSPALDALNREILDIAKMTVESKRAVWPLVLAYAKDRNWFFDEKIKTFMTAK